MFDTYLNFLFGGLELLSTKTTKLNPFAIFYDRKSILRNTTHPQSWNLPPMLTVEQGEQLKNQGEQLKG